jgi:hypothetical protein
MREGGVFYKGSPHSNEYGRTVLYERKQKEKLLQRMPPVTFLPTRQQMESYTETQGLHTPEEYLAHEHKLAKQLSEAIFIRQTEEVEALRHEILHLSNHLHHTLDTPLKDILDLLQKKISHLKHAPIDRFGDNSKIDIEEREEQREHEIQTYEAIMEVLRQRLTGIDMIRALKAQDEKEGAQEGNLDPLNDFEYDYKHLLSIATDNYFNPKLRKDREEAEQEIKTMRAIRDRLYHDLLYPGLANTKHLVVAND